MAHLIQCIGIQQYPTQLNDLSRVLGHVDAVLVTGSGDVDDNVSVDLEGRALLRGHVCGLGGSVGALEPILSRIELDATPLSEDACLAMGVKKKARVSKKGTPSTEATSSGWQSANLLSSGRWTQSKQRVFGKM